MSAGEEEKRNQDIFCEYVRNMPDSSGKRFITIHIEKHGFDAFEKFWDKIRRAIMNGSPTIGLDNNEKESLAEVFGKSRINRRYWLINAAALAATVVGFRGVTARLGNRMRDNKAKTEGIMDALKDVAPPTMLFVSGISAIFVADELRQLRLDTLTEGESGKRNIATLVKALDTMFLPIEVAMSENAILDNRGNKPHAREI
ncbi:MAG: hypothetical protein KGI29_00115 [Pseudomonadota bacterium]|nr:hypothetical protein [Pseudomonadota bacterium]